MQMKKSADYLIDLKRKFAIAKNRELAKMIGTTEASISRYLSNDRVMDDLTAVKVAKMLEIDEGILIGLANMEKAQDEKDRKIWADYIKKLGGIAASGVMAVNLILTPTPSEAAQDIQKKVNSVYYVKFNRLLKRLNQALAVLKNCQMHSLRVSFAG
jgi:predicted transcriptional regulator